MRSQVNSVCIRIIDYGLKFQLRYQLLRMLGVDEMSDKGTWHPLCVSCTIPQLYCSACSECTDLDVCQAKSWNCPTCNAPFPASTIEYLLLERVNQLMVAYTIQDFKCSRCSAVSSQSNTICTIMSMPPQAKANIETWASRSLLSQRTDVSIVVLAAMICSNIVAKLCVSLWEINHSQLRFRPSHFTD